MSTKAGEEKWRRTFSWEDANEEEEKDGTNIINEMKWIKEGFFFFFIVALSLVFTFCLCKNIEIEVLGIV